MSTVAVLVAPSLSVTLTCIVAVSSALTDGATNVAFAGFVLSTVIVPAVPAVWLNWYVAIVPSASLLVLASRAELPPSFTVVGLAVIFATGAWFTLFTVTTIVSVAGSPSLSVTVNLKVSCVSDETEGATNVAFAGFVLSTVIVPAVPAVWLNWYVAIVPSESLLVLASRAELPPSFTVVGLAVIFATGAWFTLFTFISTVSVAVCPFPSLTVSLNVNVSPFAPTSGAVNVGVLLLASLNVAAVPAV